MTTARSVLLPPKTPPEVTAPYLECLSPHLLCWSAWLARLDGFEAGPSPSATRRGIRPTPRVTERPLLEFIAASNKLPTLSTGNRSTGWYRLEDVRRFIHVAWGRLVHERHHGRIVQGRPQREPRRTEHERVAAETNCDKVDHGSRGRHRPGLEFTQDRGPYVGIHAG